jgi:hypothetical protein
MKDQIPNSKLQRNFKLQAPKGGRAGLKFDVWNFSGAWMLVLGAFLL